jgi:hypothetical protein
MDVAGVDVHVGEQVLPHVAPVAVGAVRRHRIVLVEVEGDDAREVHGTRLMAADQLAVDADRRAAGGEPEDGVALRGRLAADYLDDAVGEQHDQVVVVGHDDAADALALARAVDDRGCAAEGGGGGRGSRGQTFTSIVAPRL